MVWTWRKVTVVGVLVGLSSCSCEEPITVTGLYDIGLAFRDEEGTPFFSSGNTTSAYSRDSLDVIEMAPNPGEDVTFYFTFDDRGKTYNGGLRIDDSELDVRALDTTVCASYQFVFRKGDIDTLGVCYGLKHLKDCDVRAFTFVEIEWNGERLYSSTSEYPTLEIVIVKK